MSNKSKRRLLVIVAICAILAVATALAATTVIPSLIPQQTNSGGTNPDDAQNHLQVKVEDGNLVLYNTVTGAPVDVDIGTTIQYGEYVYVYGRYFNPYYNDADRNSTLNWSDQYEDIGWGCAVANDYLENWSFGHPAGVINGLPVTWMTYAYYNAQSFGMNNALYDVGSPYASPMIPETVKHTDYMFKNCYNLKYISITTASTISSNTFGGEGFLTSVFIGQSVKRIDANAFGTMTMMSSPQDYTIYLDGTVPANAAGGTAAWHGNHTVYENADILIWADAMYNNVDYIPDH